jgi:hypothetical protein
MTISALRRSDASIRVEEGTLVIDHLVVVDRDVVALIETVSPEERAEMLTRALSVGARGLMTMGLGIDVASVDGRVRQTLLSVTDDLERRVAGLLASAQQAVSRQFDPDQRTSLVAKAVAELDGLKEEFLGGLDPDRDGSATTEFLARLGGLLGDGGDLERRLAEALDPDSDGSALQRVTATLESRFGELRDLIVHQHGVAEGRAEEAARGTAHGLAFEDRVEAWARTWASAVGGCVVERTGLTSGALGKVGDVVVTLPDGARIVVEAKNQATIGLAGKDGILKELDRAIDNRDAQAAVCISGRPAFPSEVGSLGVYGTRVLAVDDDGTMTGVALTLARAAIAASATSAAGDIDVAAVTDEVTSIRKLADQLRTARATLTSVRKSVDGLGDTLGDLRSDLLDRTAAIERALAAGARRE